MDYDTERAIFAVITAAVATAIELLLDNEADDMVEEEHLEDSSSRRAEEEDDYEPAPRRKKRAKYNYADSKRYIKRDFLGTNPNVRFNTVFRISKERFMAIFDDIKDSGNKFWHANIPRSSDFASY